jgi:hypothetical protein
MRIKMLTHIAACSWSAIPGQEIELNNEEAKRLIEKGYATEVAIVRPSENAAKNVKSPARAGERRSK